MVDVSGESPTPEGPTIVTSPRASLARVVLATAAAVSVLAPLSTAEAGYADATISTATVTVPMMFPVLGPTSYVDTFLACRDGCARKHFGQDLMGPKMRPLVAAFNGVVSSVKRETTVGDGNYVTVRGDNGWSANYLHVNNDTPGTDDGRGTAKYAFAPGIREGARVFAGQLLGWSGDSGNAESTGPHLHFELRKGDAWSGTVYNAFSSLNHAAHLSKPRVAGPHPEGSYVKTCATCAVYEIRDGKRHWVQPPVMAQRAVTPGMAVTISGTEMAWYPRGAATQLPGGRAYKGPDGRLWFVSAGKRYPVPNATALKPLGIATARVRTTTSAALATVPAVAEGTPLPASFLYEGALLRPAGTTTDYLLTGGVLRLVPDADTKWSWGLRTADAIGYDPVAAAADPAFPKVGAVLPMHDGQLIEDSGGRRYVVSRGARHGFGGSMALYTMYGWSTVSRRTPSSATITRLPLGSALP
jgi:hypothetical protein